MSLIPTVGRRSWKIRLQVLLIYFLLTVGAVTMIYPFMIMVSGSFKSDLDINDYDIFPRYFRDDATLFRKYTEARYNERSVPYNIQTQNKVFSFRDVVVPENIVAARVDDWRAFLKKGRLPKAWRQVGELESAGGKVIPRNMNRFHAHLDKLSGGSLDMLRVKFGLRLVDLRDLRLSAQEVYSRRFSRTGSAFEKEVNRWADQLEDWETYYACLDGAYQEFLRHEYGSKVEKYAKARGKPYTDWRQIRLARTVSTAEHRDDWIAFVQLRLHPQFIELSPEARPGFVAYLEKLYKGSIGRLNKRYGTEYGSFDEVLIPAERLMMTSQRGDLETYIEKVKPEYITLTGPDYLYRDFLRATYADDLLALNQAHQAEYGSFEEAPLPYVEADYADFLDHKKLIFREFVVRNYRMVLNYIVLHGRSLWNTLLYCALAITAALTINPLAAYALSRYNLPTTYKVLLFCMATMAFPPMVTMIPNFLLLKEMHLLNTFWALVLPGMANGYSIFLLKGFFDSLPRELYEAATIDGASEWVVFWNITMSLSKPILAVLGLSAFTMAYGNFMFAFIVCQNSKMWTLMVWLYQLQLKAHRGVTFAGLMIAAIPTFLIFLFCQKLIMRGIVVPTEK